MKKKMSASVCLFIQNLVGENIFEAKVMDLNTHKRVWSKQYPFGISLTDICKEASSNANLAKDEQLALAISQEDYRIMQVECLKGLFK